MIYDVIIIGAGAAGLFAAANLPAGNKSLVLEKGSGPGKKLLLAGAGQCNITHGGNMRDFLVHYGSKGKTIRPILYQFGNGALMNYFKERGVPLAPREDGKVFPVSMSAEDILHALVRACEDNGVSFAYGAAVTDIRFVSAQDESAAPLSHLTQEEWYYSVTGGGVEHRARRLIIAAGGKSYPKTGSDGSIMPILRKLGQPINDQRPALTPIFTRDYPYAKLSGVSLKDIRVSAVSRDAGGVSSPKKRGDMLLTHKGFSGPVILELSRYVRKGGALNICYLPGADEKSVYQLLSGSVSGCQKQFSTLIGELYGDRIPRRFLDRISQLAGISPSEKASRIKGGALKKLAAILTGDVHVISGVGGFEMAMVTSGGVSLESVDLKNLQSTVCPGIYFAGEVLDVDGDTGGYNLQFAFSSGYLAARLL